MEYLLILSCMAIAFSIGANDIANAIGTTVGSNVLNYKRAIIYAGVAVCIGALLGGSNNIGTVGKGIIDTSTVDAKILALALFCAAITVGIATYLSFPVSATQSLVGSLAGTGLAMGLEMDNDVILGIAAIWALLPLISLAVSFLLFFVFQRLFKRLFSDRHLQYENIIRLLVVASSLLVAFSLGTNNIGNVVGVLDANDALRLDVAVMLGAACITLGSILFSKRVILAIGKRITTLDPLRAFVSQLSSSLSVLLCTYLGIPVSLSQATVGSIMGVGLTKGRSSINKGFIARVLLSWVMTPLISGSMMYVAYWVIA